MASRDGKTVWWPLIVSLACLALAIASPLLFSDAWDRGFALSAVAVLAGIPFYFVGGRLGAREPGARSSYPPAGRTLWWPFVLGMGYFILASTAPFAYRRVVAAGLLVAGVALLGGIGVMYLGKVLMRQRSR